MGQKQTTFSEIEVRLNRSGLKCCEKGCNYTAFLKIVSPYKIQGYCKIHSKQTWFSML